jgi:hypothetical protein
MLAFGCGASATAEDASSGPSERSKTSERSQAESGAGQGGASSELSGTVEPEDESLRADDEVKKKQGFGSSVQPVSCVSKAEDGSIIEGDELPAGAGRWLECTTAVVPSKRLSLATLSTGGWCRTGELYAARVDPKWERSFDPATFIATRIVSWAPDAPWTLVGTRAGDPIVVPPLENSVQANAGYRVIDGRPERPGEICF